VIGAFLITGLPRSRTAWMAAATTGSQSICHHEPIQHMKRWQDVYELWGKREREFVGVSDSSMGFHLGEILDNAAPRTVIVHRRLEDVEESLVRQGFPISTNYCDVLRSFIEPFRSHRLVMNVEFDHLSIPAVVIVCLEHLLPGVRIDPDWVDEMISTNIQSDARAAAVSSMKRIDDIPSLLGPMALMALRAR
jgi:hypothetical protein